MKTKFLSYRTIVAIATAMFSAGSFVSCTDVDSKINNSNNDLEETPAYLESFKNYKTIDVKIDSDYDGMLFSVFFKFPYSEGDLVEQPFLMAKAPFNTTLNVPKDVDSLYIISNGEMSVLPSKDVNMSIQSSNQTKLGEETIGKISAIVNSKYFPEQSNNVRGEDLYKCTDIVIAETGAVETFEQADIWITYLSDGGFSNSSLYGKLWFYTYPTEKMKTLTLNDCSFYGMNANGEIIPVDYNKISKKNDNKNEVKDDYIFWSKKENTNTKKGIHTKVTLGRFAKGQNIGFVFRGTNERCQFTTPCLNLSSGSYSYIGKSFNYRDKSGSFTPQQNVSNGFICHINEEGLEMNVLGMENRTTNNSNYDGDYNDMLCLIETNPVTLKPAEEIFPSELDEYMLEKGLYIFEDNYPAKGDLDFNDVVVEYEIYSYINKSKEKGKKVNTKLLASGSTFSNTFGFKSGDKYIPVYEKVQGMENVAEWSDMKVLNESTNFFGDEELKPFIHNGYNYIFETNYNANGEYPYVLIIPSANSASSKFRWCLESKKITDAYEFEYPRANDWYIQPATEELVVKRDK